LAGENFLKFFIKQIEAIKFASDWQRRNEKPGVRKFKRDFVRRAFREENAVAGQEGELEDSEIYQKNFSAFKMRHGKTITARNYLWQLYLQVCLWSLFLINIFNSLFLFGSLDVPCCLIKYGTSIN
jgi:hypothetical protein